ncbi:uncharacterized protein EI90DRAFT_1734258 [Cantharellus anzutake]|uniref:uncharacterized protein n=1 Tax=Cantharellus anzutake TaxID=1750568 RepID=UPI001905C6E4|nr:uncharacterized protein EI90DRAFT_1734258 [Cantharellus anzutake]KAF8341411.1 hypothetical protein EI90DRAFT_1734258 [Cantharellus anzutake]
MIDDSPCTPSIVATRSPPLDGDHNSPVISSVLEQSDPTFDLADRSFHPAFPLETMAANASRAVVQPVSVYSSEYLHNLDETYLGLKSEVGHSDHPSVPQNNHQELSLFPVETERSSTASKSLNKLREESSSWLPTFYPLMDSHPRMYHYNLGSIDPSRYPSFNLCPTFRPHSSASIFPGRAWVCENSFTSDAPDPFRYPFIVIYPTVYPWIEPYPVIAGHPSPEPAPATWRCMQETHSNIHRPTLPNSSEPEVSEEDGPFLSPASASTTDTPLEVQIGIFDRSILTMTFTPDVLDLVTGIMNEAVSGGRDGEFHEVDAPSGFSELGAGVRFPAGGFSLAGQRDLEINSMSKNGQCTPSEYSDDGHQRRFQSVTRAAASISSFKAESPFPQDVPPGSSPHFDGPYDEDDEGDEEAPCLEQLRCTVTSSI